MRTRQASMAASLAWLPVLAAPVAAQTVEQALQCNNDSRQFAPALQIAACTALIQSGRLDSRGLSSAHNNRGIVYGQQSDHARAIAEFTEAIRLNPQFAQAYYNRGSTYGEQGSYARAIADFTEAIRFDPQFAQAYHNRGFAYLLQGNHARAIADTTVAIRLNPQLAQAYRNRARSYEATGDAARAAADRVEAARLEGR